MRYRFADCILDMERHELWRMGDRVSVEPQVFDLLHLLVRRAGVLLSHDELIEEIWSGRAISDSALSSRINAARKAVGDNGRDQRVIRTVPRRGFVLGVPVTPESQSAPPKDRGEERQIIKFCQSKDGTRIGYAVSGNGPALVRAGHFLTHLEKDWHSPIWRPYLEALGRSHTVIRYDQRGTGLSDPSLRSTDLESYAADLQAVADAAGLESFPLIASSQGVPAAIHFAANHPDRVTRLVLYGGYAQGRAVRDPDYGADESRALVTMIRAGWGKRKSGFMAAFTSLFCPGATPAEIANLVDIQLASATPENAARIRVAIDEFDVSKLLSRVIAPTLVIHASADSVHPASQGQLIASAIAGAEYLQVESNNHIALPSDPAFTEIVTATLDFLSQ